MKAMGIKTDQERVKTLLKDTITLLCKNGLSFKTKFSIEAVIGVTLDEDDVFLLSMNELVKAEGAVAANTDSPPEQRPSSRSAIDENTKHRRKRKRRHTKSEPGADSGKEHSSSDEDPARFEEDLSDGVSDDDQSSGQSSPKKRHEVNKQEPEDDDSSSKDIIYVKEEPRESWTENPGPSQHLESLPDFSQASFSQEPNFSMLPGLGEINNAEWPATTIGMLQNPPSSQRVSWQSGGLAAMDRMQPEQDGESSQQLDSSQRRLVLAAQRSREYRERQKLLRGKEFLRVEAERKRRSRQAAKEKRPQGRLKYTIQNQVQYSHVDQNGRLVTADEQASQSENQGHSGICWS